MGRSRSRSPARRESRRSRSRSRERRRSSRSRSRERRRRSPAAERRRSRSPKGGRRRSSPRRARSSSNSPSRGSKAGSSRTVKNEPRAITEEDLEGKTEEEIEMLKIMGFSEFDSTKGRKVDGAVNAYAINVSQKRKYRQYMNRKGGFNRPLDFVA